MNIRVALKSVGMALLVMASGSMGSSQGNAGLPEFFGFYALDGGQNVAIYEGQGSQSAKSAGIEWYSIPQNSKLQDTRPQVSTSARFVLFYTNSGEMIQSLSLHKLPFVRQIIETLPAGEPSPFSPPSRRVVDSPNLPLLAAIPELDFRLLAKPVPNQPQMVELVASPQLTPGLYVVQYSPSGANGWFAIFSVAGSAEAENPFCLDLILPGGQRGLFERANSELNSTVPALASYRYTKCDMSTTPNATAVPGVNSGVSNTAVSGTRGALPAPVLIAPDDGSVFSNFPRTTHFQWEPVSGAKTYTVEVQLLNQIDGSPDEWVDCLLKTGVAEPSFTYGFPGMDSGRWRVWGVNPKGVEGDKSPWRQFRYTQ